MDNILEKARQMIRLAANPATTPDEARTVAYKAALLIHEHDLLGATTPSPSPAANFVPVNTQVQTKILSNQELRAAVEKESDGFIQWLKARAARGESRTVNIAYMVSRCIQNGVISQADEARFRIRLYHVMTRKVSEGVVVCKRGKNGGYSLPNGPNPMEELLKTETQNAFEFLQAGPLNRISATAIAKNLVENGQLTEAQMIVFVAKFRKTLGGLPGIKRSGKYGYAFISAPVALLTP